MPYHSIGSLFKGRNEEIDRLFTGLIASRSHADAIVGNALYGLGGIGKTKLAVEYAWRHKDDYTALLFVPADTPEKLASSLASLSHKTVLDLPEQNEQEERMRYEAVIRWLQQSSNWLLILDNADTKAATTRVESLFSKELHGGHVLITSRQANWSSQVNTLMLDVLNEGAATSFLLQRTDGKRRKTTDNDNLAFLIANDLGYLALALEQAAAYINKRKLTLSQYRVAWQLNHEEVLQWHDVQLMQYPTSVAVTWQTSVEQLSTDAKLLLDMLAWLAPDPIPESLILTKASDEESFDKYASLIELSEYSLVNRSDEHPDFTVHRLVQDVTRKKQDEEKSRRIITACFHWIDKAFLDNPEDVRKWPVSEPLIQHVLELTTRRLEMKHDNIEAESRLVNDLGMLYFSKGKYQDAEPLLLRALEININSEGEDHPSVATNSHNLGLLRQAINQPEQAEELMLRAIQIEEKNFGKKHSRVAVGINNLAQLYLEMKRYPDAEPLMRRAHKNR